MIRSHDSNASRIVTRLEVSPGTNSIKASAGSIASRFIGGRDDGVDRPDLPEVASISTRASPANSGRLARWTRILEKQGEHTRPTGYFGGLSHTGHGLFAARTEPTVAPFGFGQPVDLDQPQGFGFVPERDQLGDPLTRPDVDGLAAHVGHSGV